MPRVRYDCLPWRTRCSLFSSRCCWPAPPSSASRPAITPRLIEEALGIGQSRIESVRARFHQPYRLQVAPPALRLHRRHHALPARRPDHGGTDATWESAGSPSARPPTRSAAGAGVVELRVEMTFHPQNVFVGVPGYDVELVRRLARRAADAAGGRAHSALWPANRNRGAAGAGRRRRPTRPAAACR